MSPFVVLQIRSGADTFPAVLASESFLPSVYANMHIKCIFLNEGFLAYFTHIWFLHLQMSKFYVNFQSVFASVFHLTIRIRTFESGHG